MRHVAIALIKKLHGYLLDGSLSLLMWGDVCSIDDRCYDLTWIDDDDDDDELIGCYVLHLLLYNHIIILILRLLHYTIRHFYA